MQLYQKYREEQPVRPMLLLTQVQKIQPNFHQFAYKPLNLSLMQMHRQEVSTENPG